LSIPEGTSSGVGGLASALTLIRGDFLRSRDFVALNLPKLGVDYRPRQTSGEY